MLRKEKADAVSHGATGKGNDQVRFELTYLALEPTVTIVAPWRDPKWDMMSRTKMLDYAEKHGARIIILHVYEKLRWADMTELEDNLQIAEQLKSVARNKENTINNIKKRLNIG